MKALTVCAGWAELFFLPDNAKDVENRSWQTSHRGSLLIHEGKSRKEIENARDYCDYIGVSFVEPIACNGSLLLWTPSIEIKEKVEEQL